MKRKRKKPTVEAVIKTCTWCEKRIPPNHERFSVNCQKRPNMDISQYEGDIMAVRLTTGRTVWALVPTADSAAKRAGHDFMFLVCSDACGAALSDVLQHEQDIGDLLCSPMKDNMPSSDTEDEDIANSIRQHGWHAISVDASEYTPRFLYTIGLMDTYDHPEVIVFGLDPQGAHTLLCHLVDDLKHGKTYAEEGVYEGLLEGFSIAIRPVHPTQHLFYFGYALGHIRHSRKREHLDAVQLLWPDKTSTFPFEAGCDDDVCHLQPRLDREVPPSEIKEFYREYGNSS